MISIKQQVRGPVSNLVNSPDRLLKQSGSPKDDGFSVLLGKSGDRLVERDAVNPSSEVEGSDNDAAAPLSGPANVAVLPDAIAARLESSPPANLFVSGGTPESSAPAVLLAGAAGLVSAADAARSHVLGQGVEPGEGQAEEFSQQPSSSGALLSPTMAGPTETSVDSSAVRGSLSDEASSASAGRVSSEARVQVPRAGVLSDRLVELIDDQVPVPEVIEKPLEALEVGGLLLGASHSRVIGELSAHRAGRSTLMEGEGANTRRSLDPTNGLALNVPGSVEPTQQAITGTAFKSDYGFVDSASRSNDAQIGSTASWLISQRGGVVSLDLIPPGLGQLRMELRFESGGDRAFLIVQASSDAARASIDQSIDRLKETFGDNGVSLSVSVHSGNLSWSNQSEKNFSAPAFSSIEPGSSPVGRVEQMVETTEVVGRPTSELSLYV